jgi:uncharacterized protein YqjF (DUF2071 family)
MDVDRRGRTARGDVLHPPWPLRDATVTVAENTLVHASTRFATHARRLVTA